MAKAIKKQVLGRGLSALLNDPKKDIQTAQDENADKLVGSVVELKINTIEVNPFQPRTNFNEDTLSELAESIRHLGVIQPITVRKTGFNKFQLVSGERRFRAAQLVGLKTIPSYIRIANDQESLEMALVENIQRQDLDPIEIALSYQQLIENIQITQDQLSKRVGKKRSTISNYLRLLKLDPIIQSGIRDGFISMGHGRAILPLEDKHLQIDVYEKIVSESMSVRASEDLVRKLINQDHDSNSADENKNVIPPYIEEGLKDFSGYFGHKIAVKVNKNGGGKISIPFHSEEDFNRIKKLINRDK